MSGEHTYRTHPATEEYKDGWERIYGKKKESERCKTFEEIAADVYNRAFSGHDYVAKYEHKPYGYDIVVEGDSMRVERI